LKETGASQVSANLSNLLARFVAKNAGYNASFLMLAAIATLALAVFWFLVPETKELKVFALGKSTVAR
jgi:predicted MFS family arabinose efflux permease